MLEYIFIFGIQYIHYRLAELKTEVEMLRAGLYSATDNFLAGNDVTEMASMVKLKVSSKLKHGRHKPHEIKST